jgi:hypothetical protein
MHKLYLLAAFTIMLASCDALTKPTSLKGTYKAIGKEKRMFSINKFELTDTKFIASAGLGEQAIPYNVEDGYVYAGPKEGQIRFKIVSPDTLRNESNMGFEGTYVKVSR